MDYLTGIVALVIGLLISIALHELGHFIPAKRFGILCTQYMIGFGPTLYSRQIGETEVGIKAILLGGYVRMVGMYAPGREGRKIHNRQGRLTAAEEARRAAAAEIPPGSEDRAFYAQSVSKRLLVMVSGTLVNLLLSLLCVLVALSAIGVNAPTLTIDTVTPGSPAAVAAVQPGDKVLAWNGTRVNDWVEVQQLIGASTAGKEAKLSVERGGETLTLSVVPKNAGKHAIIGVVPTAEKQRLSLGVACSYEWSMALGTARILLALPVKLWQTLVGLFQPEKPRDPNSLIGIIGMGQVAGSIAASDTQGYSFSDKVASFLLLFASLNMTLFMFNLIPLMPLDGGQVAGALYEVVRKRVRRWRGLDSGGPVDLARMLPVTTAVVFAFIAMTVLLIIADLVKPVF